MSECARCNQRIELGELYAEVKRRGDHDVYRESESGQPFSSVPVMVHVDCPSGAVGNQL